MPAYICSCLLTFKHLLMPFATLYAFALACTKYFPLLLLVTFTLACVFFLAPPCAFTPTYGPILSTLHCIFSYQYLDQPVHYAKYLNQFQVVLLVTVSM